MARKLLLLGVAAIAAGVFLKRDKVAGLLPGRGETYTPPSPHPPGPSNYDAPGPVANTATPVPAPDPQEPGAIDEDAEEAAAAAEAANIGGVVSAYAGSSPDEIADEAHRPLAEAGEGESEGQEQAEFELEQAAEPTAPGISDAERQIDEAIDEAGNPRSGETVEAVRPADEPSGDVEAIESPAAPAEPPDAGESPATGESSSGATGESSGTDWSPPVPEPSDEPAPFEPADEEKTTEFEPPTADNGEGDEEKKDEGGSDWRTWSGRSINP